MSKSLGGPLKIAGVFALGLLLCIKAYSNQLVNEYCANDDVRQYVFWTYSYHDPQLFENNLFAEYARYISTPGLKAFYYLISVFADPIAAGKWLTVFLMSFAFLLIYLLGENIGGPFAGLSAALLFFANPINFANASGGLHRTFAPAFLALTLLIATYRKMYWAGFLLAAEALIHPLSAMVSLLTFIPFAAHLKNTTARQRMIALMGFGAFAAAVFIAVTAKMEKPDFLGSFITKTQMLTDPRFHAGGSAPFLPVEILTQYLGKYLFTSPLCSLMIMLSPAFLFFRYVQASRVSRFMYPILCMLAASCLLFILSQTSYFYLFLPERYLINSLTLIEALLCAMGAAAPLILLRKDTPYPQLLTLLIAGIFFLLPFRNTLAILLPFLILRSKSHRQLVAVLLLGIFFNFAMSATYSQRSYNCSSVGAIRLANVSLYQYLRTLPKDSLIAASPYESDNIAAFAQRSTLVTWELAHPWFENYRDLVETRVRDFFHANYTDDPHELQNFFDKYHVNYMVVSKEMFADKYKKETLYFEPLASSLKQEFKDKTYSDALAYQLKGPEVIFENQLYKVISSARYAPSSVKR